MTTALLDLVKNGEWGAVNNFLQLHKNGCVDAMDADGMTALTYACFYSRVDITHQLLKRGANPNITVSSFNYTPLMFAVLSGSREVVLQLIAAGADVNVKNTKNRTAMDLAAFIGHSDCIKDVMTQQPSNPNT
eukprot:m.25582 g.25582  ORF g.25582 m.25582 type:complete len:133 (-) comp5778_c0_seq1:235-633(-)